VDNHSNWTLFMQWKLHPNYYRNQVNHAESYRRVERKRQQKSCQNVEWKDWKRSEYIPSGVTAQILITASVIIFLTKIRRHVFLNFILHNTTDISLMPDCSCGEPQIMSYYTLCYKNDFFRFPKVKWLHTTGEMDKSVRCLCEIFSGFNIPKTLKSVKFWRSYLKNKKLSVVWNTVYWPILWTGLGQAHRPS